MSDTAVTPTARSDIPRRRTDRLLLRDWGADELAPFAAMNADPVVMAHYPSTLTSEESDAIVHRNRQCWRSRGLGLWAVELVETHRFIGYVGLWPADHVDGTPQVEVGWRLEASAWGKGFAPEAARSALAFGYDTIGLDEIISFTVPQNRASWRVMEKIGLRHRPERDFDHHLVDAIRHPDLVHHVFFSLTRSEWKGARET